MSRLEQELALFRVIMENSGYRPSSPPSAGPETHGPVPYPCGCPILDPVEDMELTDEEQESIGEQGDMSRSEE